MTIKRLNVSLSTQGANGADKAWLGCGSSQSVYPQTFSGITYGWTANPSGISSADTSAIDAVNFPATTIVAAGTSVSVRIDRAAGTFTIKIVGVVPAAGFAAARCRVLDSDGTTERFAAPLTSFVGPASNTQINTDGAGTTSIGSVDAGVSVTTTGAFFFVELVTAGSWNGRLGYIEWDDAAGGASICALRRRRAA